MHMIRSIYLLAALATLSQAAAPEGWWNAEWPHRQPITINAGTETAAISETLNEVTVLVRLHDGNFSFASAQSNGADLRFIAQDGKTVLPHSIERFDNLINEAFVWVQIPVLKADEPATINLYYGSANTSTGAATASDAFDSSTVLFHNFAQQGAAFQDATANGNHSEYPGTTSDGGIIGSGLRLLDTPLVIPASPTLEWTAGQELTVSSWIRPAVLQENAVIFSRTDGENSLRILLNQGIPLIQISGRQGTAASTPGEPLPAATWAHLSLVSADGNLSLLVNGEPYSSLTAMVPAINSPVLLGGNATASPGQTTFNGELDAFTIANTARSNSWLRFSALSQGATETAQRALFLGEIESAAAEAGHNEALEHMMLFGDIAKDMMFDGWIAVGVCIIMIIFGWTVAIQKFLYLNSIEKGSAEFVRQWKSLSRDLTSIDHDDEASVKTLGGNADPKKSALLANSPLFQIYSIGSEEIRHRLARDKDRTQGLSGRSIQAIRAALDTGLVRAQQKLTSGLIFLTVSIAGGPYVGLLGTVVGVMITFAIISKSGEVDVNSIAPGIASALLATVAGLVVAIPALFIYSYLNGRIKNVIAEIKVFIDEFVAKMAEFYPPAGEISPYSPSPELTGDNPNPTLSDHQPTPG